MRHGLVIAALAGLIVALPGAAAATGVAPNPKNVSGAFTTVSSCGSLSGIGVSWTSAGDVVISVVLTSIPSACAGGSLSLTLVNASNVAQATAGPVNVAGTTQTLSSLTGSAFATSVTGAHVSVVGP